MWRDRIVFIYTYVYVFLTNDELDCVALSWIGVIETVHLPWKMIHVRKYQCTVTMRIKMKRVCFVSALCTFADLSLIPNISGMLFFSGTQSVHVRAISYQTKCIQRNISVLIQAMYKTTIAVADILHTNISCSKQNDKMRQLYREQSEWNTLVCAVSMCPPT